MKHGKRLKRRHKEFLSAQGYKHKEYLVVKDTPEHMEFVNIKTEKLLLFRY